MKRSMGLTFLFVIVLAFAAQPALAYSVAPVDAFTASAAIDGLLTGVTLDGQTFGTSDLRLGDVTLYQEPRIVVTPDASWPPQDVVRAAESAENFDFGNHTTLDNLASGQSNSIQADFLEVVFTESNDTYFLFERGNRGGPPSNNHDSGTIWALDIAGNVISGSGVSFDDGDYFHSSTVQANDGFNDDDPRYIGAFAYTTDVPTYGIKIEADGMDIPIVAAVPVPGAVWLLGSGLLGLVVIRRRKR